MSYPTYLQDYEVFPFSPLAGMKEKLSTMTQVIRSRDGSEQRISLRKIPRQMFDFFIYLGTSADLALLNNLLFGWQKEHWGLPVWTDKTIHTETLSAGASTITFDTTYADYRDDTLAIIWQTETNFEVVKIDTVYPTYLSLDGVTTKTFTGQKIIMPCRLAQLVNTPKNSMPNRSEGKINFSFMVVDNVLMSFTPSVTYYDGSGLTYEVVTEPSLAEEEDVSNADFLTQDYGMGGFEYFSESDYNILSRTYKRRNSNKQECWEFRQWLHSFYGRQNAKMFPTFKDDISLINSIGAADVTFNVTNKGLASNVGVNSLRNHLAFILSNGNRYYREITNITQIDADSEAITIDSSIGEVVQTSDVVSFLDKCRLGSDDIDIVWDSGHENICNLTLIGVTA